MIVHWFRKFCLGPFLFHFVGRKLFISVALTKLPTTFDTKDRYISLEKTSYVKVVQ